MVARWIGTTIHITEGSAPKDGPWTRNLARSRQCIDITCRRNTASMKTTAVTNRPTRVKLFLSELPQVSQFQWLRQRGQVPHRRGHHLCSRFNGTQEGRAFPVAAQVGERTFQKFGEQEVFGFLLGRGKSLKKSSGTYPAGNTSDSAWTKMWVWKTATGKPSNA